MNPYTAPRRSPALLPAFLALALSTGSNLTAAAAETGTRYIQLNNEVSVRRGQGMNFKPVATIPDGTAVELLQEEEEWALVRLADEKEGWIRKRYLSLTPRSSQPDNPEAAGGDPASKPPSLETLLKAAKEETGSIRKELETCATARNDIDRRFEALARESAEVVQTGMALEETRTQLETLRGQFAVIQVENSVLKKKERLTWYLAGGGTLLVGWLIGRFASLRRRKSSLL